MIVDVERDDAMLEIVRRSPCGLCGQTQGCGVSTWGRLLGHRNNVFRAVNATQARIGDQVIVGIDERALLASSLAVYGVPLATLLAGAFAGMLLAQASGDAWPVAGAVIGFVLGMLWLKGHNQARGLDARYRPVILRPAGDEAAVQICRRGN